MFKKPVKVGAQNQLSGKDKKTIKSKLDDNFHQASVDKILTMNDKIICCKISGSKMLIYNGDQYPLFVDGTGKHNYYPSLYTAIAFQPLIKTLILNEGVQTYIYNGANVMWPGVRNYEGLENFQKDQVVGIRSSKGDIIAIGAMGISKKQLSDTSSVAVYVLHYIGDQLWAMGTKTVPEIIIPLAVQEKKQPPKQQPKVQEKVVESKPQKQDKKQVQLKQTKQVKPKKKQPSPSPPKQKSPQPSDDSDDNVDFMNLVHDKNPPKGKIIQMQKKGTVKISNFDDDQPKNQKGKKKNVPEPANKKGNKKKQQSQDENQDVMQQQQQVQNPKDKKKGGKKKPAGKAKKGKDESDQQKVQKQQEQQQGQQKSTINTKLMDDYFRESMFNAIKLTKIEGQLPIEGTKFYNDYMIPARPSGVKLEIKDTSYKKLGKFFEQMNKKKYIEYKHSKDKKTQGAQITKIFWQNQDLKNHVPTIKKLGSKEEDQKVENNSKAKLKLSKTVMLETVYKVSPQFTQNVLKPKGNKEEGKEKQVEFVSEKQLRDKIDRYVTQLSQKENKQAKKDKDKQEKILVLNYQENEFLRQLLSSQIQEYQQNLKRQKDEEDEEKDAKKKKGKQQQQGIIKIDRQALVQKLMKKGVPHHHIYDKQTGLDKTRQGQFKGIQITAEKTNNKNVTRIAGLEVFIAKDEADDQIHGFANLLQTKLACVATVQNLPGKNAGKEIIVYGTFLDQLEDMLEKEYHVQSKFITTQNKLQKKKKNN